jgi:hypothetical protein
MWTMLMVAMAVLTVTLAVVIVSLVDSKVLAELASGLNPRGDEVWSRQG